MLQEMGANILGAIWLRLRCRWFQPRAPLEEVGAARRSDLGRGQTRLQAGLKGLKGAPPQTHAVQRNAHLGCSVEADEAHAEVHRQAHQVALHDAGVGLALRDSTGWGGWGGETRQEDESEATPPGRPTWIRSTSRNVAVWKAFSQISSSPSSSTLKNMSSPLSVWTLKQCFRLSRRSLSWKKTARRQVQVNSACCKLPHVELMHVSVQNASVREQRGQRVHLLQRINVQEFISYNDFGDTKCK